MSRQSYRMIGLLGFLSLGVAVVGTLAVVSARSGAIRPNREAPTVGAAEPRANTEGGTSALPTAKPAGSVGLPADPRNAGNPDANLTLGQDQREYLWQVEHHGLILSRIGFARIADALKRADAAALRTLLADKFEGRSLGQPRETRFEYEGTKVLRQQDSGQPPPRLDRDGMVRLLLADREQFAGQPTVKIALMGLAPLDHKNLDGPWQGTCQLRMFGASKTGRGEVVLYLQYRLPRPTEELLKSVGWLQFCAVNQRQAATAPGFLMREAAAERGISVKPFHDNWKSPDDIQTMSGGLNLCDFNRDGCLDLLITDLNANVLYQGRPDGTFVDVTSQVRLPLIPRLISATFADLDNDGWEDLIYGSLALKNHEGRYFAPVAAPTLAIRPQANVIAADYDRDGLVDLYVTTIGVTKTATWIKGEGGGRIHNRLLRNLGNWRFADVTESANASGGNRSTFTAVWLDADENGWPDLYVINEFGSGVLLVNRGDGTFRERAIDDDPGDFGSMGVTAGDIDNDGHIDLYVANMYSKAGNRVMGNLWPGTYPEPLMARLRSFTTGSQLHHNRGGLAFERLGKDLQVADVGWSYGPAMVDLNNDGWLDIHATCGFISRSRDDPDG